MLGLLRQDLAFFAAMPEVVRAPVPASNALAAKHWRARLKRWALPLGLGVSVLSSALWLTLRSSTDAAPVKSSPGIAPVSAPRAEPTTLGPIVAPIAELIVPEPAKPSAPAPSLTSNRAQSPVPSAEPALLRLDAPRALRRVDTPRSFPVLDVSPPGSARAVVRAPDPAPAQDSLDERK
jgi:hypothetical protein